MQAFDAQRRGALLSLAGAGLTGLLSACGGGGDGERPAPAPPPVPPAPPRILEFRAEAAQHHVGDRATLTARFEGGTARIEPGIGVVQSGVPVLTPVLDASRRYTLVLEAAGQAPQQRELDLAVGFRNRYQSLALPFPLQYHAVANAPDGSVLVIAGSRSGSVLSDAVDRYDPATRSFSRLTTLHSGRSDHSATVLPDGRVLVLGGQISLSGAPSAELIDARSGLVTAAGRLNLPRARHASVALADGRVLVVGGLGNGREGLEIWDPQTLSFRLLATRMANRREFPTATLLADGRVLIAGGWHGSRVARFAEIFDPVSERLEPVGGDIDEERAMHQAFRLSNGQVLILGGELLVNDELLPQDSVLAFDPQSGRIERRGRLDRARTLVRGVQLPDDRLFLFGGEDADRQVTASASVYRPDGSCEALAAMPLARSWNTVSRLPDGRLLILGGDDKGSAAVPGALLYE